MGNKDLKWYRNFFRAKEVFESNSTNNPSKLNKKIHKVSLRFVSNYKHTPACTLTNIQWIGRKDDQIFLWWDIMVDNNSAFWTRVGIYGEWKVMLFNYAKCKKEFEWQNLIQPYYISGETIDLKNNKERISTWPMLGFNMLTPPLDSKSYIKDFELLKNTDYENLGMNVAKKYKIYGFRRPLRTIPKNLKYSRRKQKDKFKKI